MTVYGYPVDEEFGFILACGKLDPIEFHCATPEEGYRRARERQVFEKTKNHRNYIINFRLNMTKQGE